MGARIELLAPAGSVEALHAAVENGADAVYLGGKLFNARQQADNFDMDMLKEAVAYAHARGVNIYLTLNTLVADEEMRQALLFAADAGMAGVDGIIVQDLGLAAALRKVLPWMPLHASTQMTIYDLDGVKALERMGFARVVLARELSLEEASHIARNTELEVEAFVHGALCICYSGQCLMSSIIGGRSGNRGKCAQPCRLPYELAGGEAPERKGKMRGMPAASGNAQYLLSPKDMCALDLIGEIAASGIRSLKIEGRLKSPEYVAVVVRIYRKYLDIALKQINSGCGAKPDIAGTDRHDILQIFNRGGFSSGYLAGKTGADMMSYEKPNNSGIYLGTVLSYDRRTQTAGIRLEDRLSIGDGIEIWTGGSDSPGGIVSVIRRGGVNQKSAGRGETVSIGSFRGKIEPGCRVYKTMDAELNKAARESFTGRNPKRVGISGQVVLKAGKPLHLRVEDGEGHYAASEGTALPEPAVNRPLTRERLAEQIEKTGSTPFRFDELKIELDEGLSLPVSEINELRRKALESLLKSREDRYAGQRGIDGIEDRIDRLLHGEPKPQLHGESRSLLHGGTKTETAASGKPRIALYFFGWDENTPYTDLGADRFYIPARAIEMPDFPAKVQALKDTGKEVFVWLPSVTRGNYGRLLERLLDKKPDLIDGILAGNIGTIQKIKEAEKKGAKAVRLAGDISMNIFNSLSIAEAERLELDTITLSAELTLHQIRELSGPETAAMEAVVYGRLPLMTSEYCPVGCVEGGFKVSEKCGGFCGKSGYRLKDRKGAEFPVLCDRVDCRSTILNSNVLFLPDALQRLRTAGVGIFRLNIWDEEPSMVKELVGLHRAAIDGNGNEMAVYVQLANEIMASGFTRGHFFRGV